MQKTLGGECRAQSAGATLKKVVSRKNTQFRSVDFRGGITAGDSLSVTGSSFAKIVGKLNLNSTPSSFS